MSQPNQLAGPPSPVTKSPVTQSPVTQSPESMSPITKVHAPEHSRTLVGVWIRDMVISVTIAIFIIVFVYQPMKVEGTSMMPLLGDQERIFVNKFVYRLEPIARGDVVVFRYPHDPSKSYIKRVVGVAGDRIRIDGGQVYVNGQALDEDYVPPDYADARSYPESVVPQKCYFVLGDHRSMSSDSREFGPVDLEYIYGKAVFGYWPMERMGKVR